MSTLSMPSDPDQYPPERLTVVHAGRRYPVERTPDRGGPGTAVERWVGIGVVGSYRKWRGHTWAKSLTWYAAVNPTGEPGRATVTVDGLTSRRAAIRWLLDHQVAR